MIATSPTESRAIRIVGPANVVSAPIDSFHFCLRTNWDEARVLAQWQSSFSGPKSGQTFTSPESEQDPVAEILPRKAQDLCDFAFTKPQ